MEKLNKYGPYLLIFLLAFLQYVNTFNHDYAWDDAIVITENTRVQKGLSDIPELFENIKSGATEHRYGYRPISLLSFASEVHFFGLNPTVGHVSNVLHYGLLCILILFFLNQVFPERELEMFLVTALFVVQPLHVEVVANIKSRDEILAMGFGIVGVYQFWKFNNSPKITSALLAIFALVLGFLSKENAVTFGGLALLLPFATAPKVEKKHWITVGIAVASIGILLLIRAFVYSDSFFQDDGAELVSKGVYHWDGFLGNPLFDVQDDKITLVANSLYLILLYIKQFFAPLTLIHDYGFNQLAVVSWNDPIVWIGAFFTSGLIVFMLLELKKKTSVGLGLLWFFVSISIYLHVVRVGTDIFADRFMFVPSLGLSLAFVGLVFRIKRLNEIGRKLSIAVICLSFFTISWKRNYAWHDNVTLLKTDLPKQKECVRANYNYALLLHKQYYETPESKRKKAQNEILKYYKRAYDITDRLFVVFMDLGGAYMEFGQYEKGREVFEHAIEKYPDLSIPYVQMAKYHMTFDRYLESIPYLEKARELGESNSDFYYLLAICKYNSNQKEEAFEDLLVGEKLGTSSSAYYSLMARLYRLSENPGEAVRWLQKGLQVYPSDAGLFQTLDAFKAEYPELF